MTRKIYTLKIAMSGQATEAYFSVTEAQYAAGDFKHKVFDAIDGTAEIVIQADVDNVAGVKLPIFNVLDTGEGKAKEAKANIGLGAGGKAVNQCGQKFKIFLEAMVKLASLQTSFITLDEALKVTNRRVNALENVTLPRIVGVIDYIKKELDEMEREEFTRVKKLKEKKELALIAKKKALKAAGILEAAQSSKSALDGFDGGADQDVVDW